MRHSHGPGKGVDNPHAELHCGAKWSIIPCHGWPGAQIHLLFFTGTSEHSIDTKQRLAIPAKYRNQWSKEEDGDAWFCIPWPTGVLLLFTENAFRQMARQRPATLTPNKAQAELQARLFGYAERLEMDAAGRIVIPRKHMDRARLGTEVMIVGANTRLEVWDKGRWEAGDKEGFEKMADLVSEIERSPAQ